MNKNTIFEKIIGGLAHLARALRWQRRGDRFESGILHCFFLLNNCFSSVYLLNLSSLTIKSQSYGRF